MSQLYSSIWKYTLEITDTQTIEMPDGASILSVANQDGNLCLWAKVIPSRRRTPRTIEIIGTGHAIEESHTIARRFIGSAVISPFVWHVFERCEVSP